MEVPNTAGVFDLTNTWTVAACVAPLTRGWDSRNDPIVWKINLNNDNGDTFELAWGGGDPFFGIPAGNLFTTGLERSSDDHDFVAQSNVHAPSNWYHVAGVYNGNELFVYINGVLDTSVIFDDTAPISNPIGAITAYTGPAPLRLGSITNSNHGNRGVFNGFIDDVKIWNTSLTAANVSAENVSLGCSSAPPNLPSPELIIDNDFNSGVGGDYFAPSVAGGWTVESGSVNYTYGGQGAVDLSGFGPGVIYQDVPTTPGKSYLVSFVMGGNAFALPNIKDMQVWWNGAVAGTFSFDTLGLTREWGTEYQAYHEIVVTATGAITRIKFESTTATAFGPLIINVSLVEL